MKTIKLIILIFIVLNVRIAWAQGLVRLLPKLFRSEASITNASTRQLLESKPVYDEFLSLSSKAKTELLDHPINGPLYRKYSLTMASRSHEFNSSYKSITMENAAAYTAMMESAARGKVGVITPLERYPLLKFDHSIIQIQRKLNKLGFHLNVDGIMGNWTRAAISKATKTDISELSNYEALLLANVKLLGSEKESSVIFVNKLTIPPKNIKNFVYIGKDAISNIKEYKILENFNKDFYSKFNSDLKKVSDNSVFITFCKADSKGYVTIHQKVKNRLIGRMYVIPNLLNPYNKEFKAELSKNLNEICSKFQNKGKFYLYGDNLLGLDKFINEIGAKKNITIINRNTGFQKFFNETEISLDKLEHKRLKSSDLVYLNGTPVNLDEAKLQSFDGNDIHLLQSLKNEIDAKALVKAIGNISTKEQLEEELKNGTKSVLLVVAHSDKEFIYFGSNKIGLKEIKSWPKAENREKPRIIILLSCLAGDLYNKRNLSFPFFRKNFQSFSEILLEKNYFDLVISPPSTINGEQVLKMIEELDKHDILNLRQNLNRIVDNGVLYNIAIENKSYEKFSN